MTRFTTLFSVLLGLAACHPSDDAPAGLIPETQMVRFLKDVHVAEQRVTDLRLQSQDSALIVFKRLEADLYRRHGIDTVDYRRSYQYYAARPERFKVIYQAVVDSLLAEEERIKQQTNRRSGADSSRADTARRTR